MSKLPNLYLRPDVGHETHPNGQYFFAWKARKYPEEEMYVPSSRIRELIAEARKNGGKSRWMCGKLEELLGEEKV